MKKHAPEALDIGPAVLGLLIDTANKLQIVGDRYFRSTGLTVKQWYFCALLERFGDRVPTLGELAGEMGSSYQNVKQIALKLEKKGLLRMKRDPRDSRKLRLFIPRSNLEYWEARKEGDAGFVAKIFHGSGRGEVRSLFESLRKLHGRIAALKGTKNEAD